MRVRLFIIYVSASWVWHAAAQDGGCHAAPSAACNEFNQKILDKVESGQLADAEAEFSNAAVNKESNSEQSCIWLTLHNRASVVALSGRLNEAEALAKQSIGILDKLCSPNDPIRFRLLRLLWSMEYQQGKVDKARQTFQRMQALPLSKWMDRAMLHSAAAAQFQAEGRYKEAEVEYLRAYAAWEEAGHGDTPEAATLLANLGSLHVLQAQYVDAGKALDRALAILNSAKGAVPLDLVNIFGVRAALNARQGRWQAASEDLRSAISIVDRDTRLDPAELKPILVNYAYVLRKTHRNKEARSIDVRAAAIRVPVMANAIVDVSELVRKDR